MTPTLHLRCDGPIGGLHLRVDEELRAPWTVLFGPSGSGKTSLLRLLAGLWRPAGSAVVLHGQDLSALPPHRRSAVLVAQHPALFPHLSVEANVRFGVRGNTAAVRAMLDRFRLAPLARQPAGTLSGGEAQRVCLARAMAASPRLLLLDESFTGLHRTLRDDLLGVVRALQAERSLPVVSVTHDVSEAFACADEVLRLEAGRVVARGPATEVLAAERLDLLRQLRAD